MIQSEDYKTIKSFSQGIYKDRGSKFISFAYPVSYQEEIKTKIDNLHKKYHNASHLCYAYMLGHDRQLWRYNDNGEPSGTAGKPIMGQINSFGLTNILIVVSRYFGGTLLGVSGLIKAYRSAAEDAILNAEIVERKILDYYEIIYPYTSMNDVMKIIKEEGVGQSDHIYDMECKIKLSFPPSAKEGIINKLSLIDGLKYTYINTL